MVVNKLNNLLRSKTFRNGGLFSIFSFFNQGISFVLMVILARYIAPEQYGEMSLFNTLTMFLGYFVGLQTSGYLSISFFKENKENFKKDLTAIFVITCAVTSIITFFFILLQDYLSGWLKLPTTFIFIGLASSFLSVFCSMNLDYLRVQEKIGKYGILSCTFAILNMLLSLYLVIAVNLNWKGRVYASAICSAIYAFISVICFCKRGLSFSKDWSRYKKIILWGLPIIPHLASNWIKQGLDRYIIEDAHTMAEVGLFSFALNISGVMIMVGTAFNATNSVNLYQTLSSDLPEEEMFNSLKRKERIFSMMYLFCAIVIALGGSIAVPFVMPNYIEAIPYFVILIFFGFFKCIYFLYCNYLFYYSKTKNLMYITFGTSIMHLCLSLLMTRYSLYITCGLYVVTEIYICALVYVWSQKCIKGNLIKKTK